MIGAHARKNSWRPEGQSKLDFILKQKSFDNFGVLLLIVKMLACACPVSKHFCHVVINLSCCQLIKTPSQLT